MPFRFELAFEIEIVLYDTIVDDGDSRFAVYQRVRVFLYGPAVCCPAGMSNAHGSRWKVEVILGMDLVESPAVLLDRQGPIGYGYFADGVVAPIFESFEGGVDDRGGFFTVVEDATEYSTQGRTE